MKPPNPRICFLLLGLAGVLTGWRWGAKTEVIYQGADRARYVLLVEEKKTPGVYEHPAGIPPEELERVLLELQYTRPGMVPFTKLGAKERHLFPKEDAAKLAVFLSQALARANAGQRVEFSWRVAARASEKSIFVNYLIHDGVLFVQEGRLQLAFRNIGYEEILETDMLSRLDPLRFYSGMYDLVLPDFAQWPPQNLNAQGEPLRRNWITFPLASLGQIPAPAETPAILESPAPAEPPPAAARSPEERLQQLKKLLDDGLITRQDYDRKKQEILDEL